MTIRRTSLTEAIGSPRVRGPTPPTSTRLLACDEALLGDIGTVKSWSQKKAHSSRCEAHGSALKPLPTALNPLPSALTFPRPLRAEILCYNKRHCENGTAQRVSRKVAKDGGACFQAVKAVFLLAGQRHRCKRRFEKTNPAHHKTLPCCWLDKPAPAADQRKGTNGSFQVGFRPLPVIRGNP